MNIKKLFPDNKSTKKGILEFLDNRGFYIVLVICIVIVGATAFFVMTYNANTPGKNFDAEKFAPEESANYNLNGILDAEGNTTDQSSISTTQASDAAAKASGSSAKPSGSTAQASGSTAKASGTAAQASGSSAKALGSVAQASGASSQVSAATDKASGDSAADPAGSNAVAAVNGSADSNKLTTQNSAKTASAGSNAAKKETLQNTAGTPSTSPAPAKSPENKAPANKTPAKSKTQSFIMPVYGEVTSAFAQDKLIYSKTLEEWRTHSGIDIAADRGTIVKSAADGIVSEVINDPRYGITVIIDHQNGLKTLYSNLAADDTVSPNQKVKQGDIVGSVGNTAFFESAEQSHLHFEVMKNNEPINPQAYLPVIN